MNDKQQVEFSVDIGNFVYRILPDTLTTKERGKLAHEVETEILKKMRSKKALFERIRHIACVLLKKD